MKRIEQKFSQCPEDAMRVFRQHNDIKSLAKINGCSHNVLLDRLNPERDQKLGYLEAVGHSHTTNDHTLLKSWAADLHYGLFPMPEGSVGDEEMLDLVLSIQEISGRFAAAYYKAREDGVIDSKEVDELCAILREKMNALANLKAELQGQVRSMKII